MAIIYTKPEKAQDGLGTDLAHSIDVVKGAKKKKIYSFGAVPSMDPLSTFSKEGKSNFAFDFAGAVANQAAKENNAVQSQVFYRAVDNPKSNTEGQTIHTNKTRANNKYQFGIYGKGDVRLGVPGNDTTINLNDGKIHRFNMEQYEDAALPMNISNSDGKKSTVHILQYFMGRVK